MHVPVLLRETVEGLAVKAGGWYIAGTLGRAGHAAEVMRRAGPEGHLLGIDRDGAELERARQALEAVPGHKTLVHGVNGSLAEIARANGFGPVDGVLLKEDSTGGITSPAEPDEPSRTSLTVPACWTMGHARSAAATPDGS